MPNRKICFPITSRAYYGRSQLLIKKLHAHPDIDLKLMLGGSILLDKYSKHIAADIAEGGFEIEASLFNVIEGGNHVAMAKTACLTALEFTNGLHTIDPDIVIICGDRFEQLAPLLGGEIRTHEIELGVGAIDGAVAEQHDEQQIILARAPMEIRERPADVDSRRRRRDLPGLGKRDDVRGRNREAIREDRRQVPAPLLLKLHVSLTA